MIIETYLVDLRQHPNLRPMQHPQRQADHLQVLGARGGTDIPRLRPDIVHDSLLQPGHEEVCAFVDHLVFDSGQTIEDDGALATADVVDGGGGEGEGEGAGDGPFVDLVEGVGCHLCGGV